MGLLGEAKSESFVVPPSLEVVVSHHARRIVTIACSVLLSIAVGTAIGCGADGDGGGDEDVPIGAEVDSSVEPVAESLPARAGDDASEARPLAAVQTDSAQTSFVADELTIQAEERDEAASLAERWSGEIIDEHASSTDGATSFLVRIDPSGAEVADFVDAMRTLQPEASFGFMIDGFFRDFIAPFMNTLEDNGRSDKLLVASAGNNDDNLNNIGGTQYLPCELDNILCVGALSAGSTSKASFSNYESSPDSIDIYAPGVNVRVGPTPDSSRSNTSETFGGTSAAAPLTAGIGAMVLAAAPDGTDPADIADVLVDTGNDPGETYTVIVEYGSASASVDIDVVDTDNQAPVVHISNPDDGEYYNRNDRDQDGNFNIDLDGNATDPEDGALTGSSLVWYAREEGDSDFTQVATGQSETVEFKNNQGLEVKDVTLRLIATDSQGRQAQEQVLIQLAPLGI